MDEKQLIYDEFSDYVRKTMRNDVNRKLSLCEYDLLPKAGVTHIEIIVENVDEGNSELFSDVKAFKKEAELRTKENVTDGTIRYAAFIPFQRKHKKKYDSDSDSDDNDFSHRSRSSKLSGPPSLVYLTLYGFAFLCTIILSVSKTTMDEWKFIF